MATHVPASMKSFNLSLSITLVFATFLGVPCTSRAQTPTNHRVSETSRSRAAEPSLVPFGKSPELVVSTGTPFNSDLKLARSGDVNGMLDVAADYKWGEGVTANRTQSQVWLTRAKARFDYIWSGRDTKAMFSIALSYFNGAPSEGVNSNTDVQVGNYFWHWGSGPGSALMLDIPAGMKWLRRASDLGSPQAEMYLADVLRLGAKIAPRNSEAQVIVTPEEDKSVYLALAKRAADSGDPNLMVEYATSYVTPSPQRLAIFERAANAGDLWAIDNVVDSYEKGTDGAKNPALALSWLKKGVRQGHFNSLFGLADTYCRGNIAPKDPALAVAYLNEIPHTNKWMWNGAQQGLAEAYATCANNNGANDGKALELYARVYKAEPNQATPAAWAATFAGLLTGDDSGANPKLGIQMLRLLAANAAPFGPGVKKDEIGNAAEFLGNAYYSGTGVTADKLESLTWYQKAADAGDGDAMNHVGVAYANGLGGKPDFAKAAEWYQKAADQGSWWGTYNLAGLYALGNGVPQNYEKAITLYRTVATRGNGMSQAMVALGDLYRNGTGVAKDYAQALGWYQKAASQNDSEAENNVGWMYQNGFGVTRDYQQALAWYQKAAARGNADAENNLGWFYQHGLGLQADNSQAAAWYQKAASQGNATAKQNLDALNQQIANQQQEASRQAAEQQQEAQQAAEEQANEAAQKQQDVQDKIDNLNQEIQQLESEASDADQNADNLATNSNCTGGFGPYAAVAQQTCENINSIGVAKFRSEAANDRNQADDDRAEIERLQGEEVQQAPHRDASFASALQQQMQQNPQPTIVDTANQQAANMIAIGAANDAARRAAAEQTAERAAQQRQEQQAEQQREQQAQQQAQQEAAAKRQQAAEQQASQQQAAAANSCGPISSPQQPPAHKDSNLWGPWQFIGNTGIAVSVSRVNSKTLTWEFFNGRPDTITSMNFNYTFVDADSGQNTTQSDLLPFPLKPGGGIGGWTAYTANTRGGVSFAITQMTCH
jgi:TPR repeat protein